MNSNLSSRHPACRSALNVLLLLAVTSLWAADVPVLTSPTSAVASNGYAFSYQITATGDPTGYDATGLPPGVSVNTTSGLISGSPNASGTFNVTVTATNTAGVGMGLLSLTVVYAPPVIVGQPQSLSLKSGEVAVYRVEASGQMTLSYRWTKGGAALQSTDRLSGIDGPQFSISPVLPQDAGTYEVVVAQAGLETAAQPVELLVDVVLPLVTNHPLSRSVASGDTVTFSGGASGDPTLVYRWQRDGADLDDGGRFTGTATPELTISNATAEETGWYALTVSNAGGRVASNPARLTVHTDSGYAQAVNFDEGVWTSGGDASWFVQSILTQDGLGAARSGAIGHGGTTFLETTVFGPGDLSFFWTASSEDCCDRLTLFVNGVPVDSIGGEVGWTERTLHLPWGAHTLRWQYRKDGSVEAGLDAACLDQVAFQPSRVTGLETALAAIPLPLTAGGNAPWFGQENVNADGASAGRSGYIGHGESSTVETVVSGPGVVSFDWQVSSEGCCDRLSFLVDGIVWDSIGGEVSWTNRTFHLPWGTHTLVWSYRKDGSVDAGLDAGWLDRVTYDPVGIFNLTEASDNASQPWTAGGNQPWFGQNETTHDGADALQSGPVTHGQDSLLDSAVTGPGTLTFFWKVSSEYADPLVYSLDGLEQARIAGEVDWIGQTHIIRPGTHALRWQYHKDGSVNTGQDSGWLDQVAFVPAPTLPVALNNTQLLWSTSGDANWFSQLVTTHDGVAAARTDTLGDGQAAVLETSVMGPGELSFYWKVSSEAGFDILAILMDDAEQARISGEVDWTQRALTVPDGLHTLKWRYSKDGSRGSGADAAWLDEVVLNATSTVEVPLTNPAFLNGGTQFGLSVSTVGGWTYVLEYKNALGDSEWIPLPGVAGDGTVKALIDPAPPALHRFYRVRIISN